MTEPHNPNTNADLIVNYTLAYYEHRQAERLLAEVQERVTQTLVAKQDAWHEVKRRVNDNKLRKGVYRVPDEHNSRHAAGIVISSGDYPEIHPMFDAQL